MTDALDTLRPEVRDALEVCDRDLPQTWRSQTTQWGVVRAELLRLAAAEQRWQQWIKDGMRVDFLPPEPPK